MKKEIEVTIINQDHFGKGIAKIEGKAVFVHNVLPGEICKIEVVEEKKNYAKAKVVEIISPSKERVSSPCSYSDICGGCTLLYQQEEAVLRFKEKKVKELLAHFASFHGTINKMKSGPTFHYRNKVVFRVKEKHLALFEEESHNLVKVSNCLLLTAKTNELVKKINIYLEKNKPFQEMMIRTNQKDEFMLAITGTLNKNSLLSELSEFQIVSLYQNDKIISGSEFLEESLLGMNFLLSANSFFQVNRYQTETLYQLVLDKVKEIRPNHLLDLYCGTGTIGLLASKYATKVTGIEVVESAIENAKENKERNHIKNIEFCLGKVENHTELIKKSDFVIVDPPRKGLDHLTKQKLLENTPEYICYVSCDPATLARDLNELQEKYQIEAVTPVDMFPNTYHIECVCLLSKLRIDHHIEVNLNMDELDITSVESKEEKILSDDRWKDVPTYIVTNNDNK